MDYAQRVGNQVTTVHVDPTYDNNGNLKNFVHQYTYDYRNQLLKVITGTGVTVEYKYDALGRRIEKKVTDNSIETLTRYVFDGWQVIEERDGNDVLTARFIYGNGIDERVEVEYLVSGTLTSFIPMQDTIGNVIGISDDTGKLVEKYTYSAYGAPVIEYDEIKPVGDTITVNDGVVEVRFSEPVNTVTAQTAVTLKSGGTDIPGTFTFNADGSVELFTPDNPLPTGDLTIDISTGLEDNAGNTAENALSQTINYQGADTVVYDASPPEIDKIDKIADDIIITFKERINPTTIAQGIEIKKTDGSISGTVSTVNATTFKFTPAELLRQGEAYEIWVKSVIEDLSGKNLAEFFHKFVVMDEDFNIFDKTNPNIKSTSKIGNNYLFHGRTFEPETGLYYYRHRYYLPRLGRFLQNDPMGYEDSMNMYQAFKQNLVNFVDPMGLSTDFNSFPKYAPLSKKLKKLTPMNWLNVLKGIDKLFMIGYNAKADVENADWGGYIKDTTLDTLNFVSLGALDKTLAQKDLNWESKIYFFGNEMPERVENFFTLGLSDNLKAQGATGFRGLYNAFQLTLFNLSPASDLRTLLDSEASIENKVRAGGFFASKVAGIFLLGKNPTGGSSGKSSLYLIERSPNSKNLGAIISEKGLSNFTRWKAKRVILSESDILYRVHTKGRESGAWWTRERPITEMQYRIDAAVLPEWNTMEQISILRVPKGSYLQGWEGTAAYQKGFFIGGKNQIYIPYVPEGWLTTKIF